MPPSDQRPGKPSLQPWHWNNTWKRDLFVEDELTRLAVQMDKT
jgi:hypothetical protein